MGIPIPEGPELRTSRDVLYHVLVGKKIFNVSPLSTGRYSKKSPVGQQEFLDAIERHGTPTVLSIDTRGKFMYWTLFFEGDTDTWSLWTTYGMSGQWMHKQTQHAAYHVHFGDVASSNDSLYFVDPRHFGTLKWVRGQKVLEQKLATLGPDILDSAFSVADVARQLSKKPEAYIGEALMNQAHLAGIGNYLRAEILYDCAISPWRKIKNLRPEEYLKVYNSIVKIATASYAAQGASISTYRSVNEAKGEAQFDFLVYGMKADPHGNEIIREEDGMGRTVHWCPTIQK